MSTDEHNVHGPDTGEWITKRPSSLPSGAYWTMTSYESVEPMWDHEVRDAARWRDDAEDAEDDSIIAYYSTTIPEPPPFEEHLAPGAEHGPDTGEYWITPRDKLAYEAGRVAGRREANEEFSQAMQEEPRFES